MRKEIKPRKGQESVWDYPRPPSLERTAKLLKVMLAGETLAEACFVDNERIRSQEGDFYDGWISQDIVGPFKGGKGTWGG